MDKIQGGHEIFDLQSHRVITKQKMIHISIPREIIKHIEEMSASDRVTLLKFRNRLGFIYDNDWIAGRGYEDSEDKNQNYSE